MVKLVQKAQRQTLQSLRHNFKSLFDLQWDLAELGVQGAGEPLQLLCAELCCHFLAPSVRFLGFKQWKTPIASLDTAQHFSINRKLLQDSTFDPTLHLLRVHSANALQHLSTHTFYSTMHRLRKASGCLTLSLNKAAFTLQWLAPELETFHFTKPPRFGQSLLDTAVMQQNESTVGCSPETVLSRRCAEQERGLD